MANIVAIQLEVDAGQSVKEVQNLEEAIKDIQKTTNIDNVEDKFNGLNQSIESGTNSVEGLRKAIKSYQTIALTAGRESPVGKEALLRASQLTDELTDLDNEVKRLSMDGQQMQTALQLGTTVTAGYQAFAGVTALVGDENEDLMKTMVKLQAVQSVLQGIEQARLATEKESILMLNIRNARTKIATALQTAYSVAVGAGSKAMKVFRGALIATGLGALVVLIGVIVSKWNDWTSSIFANKKALEFQAEAQEIAIENSAEELSALDKLQKKIKENVDNREGQVEAIKDFQEEHPELLEGLDAENTSYKEINAQIKANIALVKLKAEADALSEIRVEKFKEKLQEQTDALLGNSAGFGDVAESLLTVDGFMGFFTGNRIQQQKAVTKIAKENSKERIEDVEKEINILDVLDNKIQKQIEEAESKVTTTKTEAGKKRVRAKEKELEQIYQLELDYSNKIFEHAEDYFFKRLEEERKTAEYFENLKRTQRKQDLDATIEAQRREVAIAKAKHDALVGFRMDFLAVTGSVAGELSNLVGQQTKAGKALALTQIAIDTAVGFANGLRIAQQGAIATGPAAPFAMPLFYATQVAAVLSAANKAKGILKAGSSVSAPTIPSTTSRTFGTSSTSTTGTQNTGSTNFSTTPSRVYLVESDVQEMRERRENVEAVSTI